MPTRRRQHSIRYQDNHSNKSRLGSMETVQQQVEI